MANKTFFDLLKKVPQEIKNFNKLSMGIAARIDDILKERSISQRSFANLMDKNESEISKWLSGKHNFTINTVANIEAKLGVQILITTPETKTPQRKRELTFK